MTLILAFVSLAAAAPFDQSLTPPIDFQIRQFDPKLKNLFGDDSANMLCWPSSLAHRMAYLKTQMNLTKLKLKSDPVDNVGKFVSLCRTSVNGGTSQKRKLPCIRAAFKEAGYKVDAFSIGPDGENKRAVEVKDLLENLKTGHSVILHVAWMKGNEERGSHSVNAYGFDYNNSWGNDRIVLKINNPGEDYAGKPPARMLDDVSVQNTEGQLNLTGPGFDRADRRAVIKNIFVFKPR